MIPTYVCMHRLCVCVSLLLILECLRKKFRVCERVFLIREKKTQIRECYGAKSRTHILKDKVPSDRVSTVVVVVIPYAVCVGTYLSIHC